MSEQDTGPERAPEQRPEKSQDGTEWWSVSLGITSYRVRAASAVEAVDKAQSAYESNFGLEFPTFTAELDGEDSQPDLDEKYPDRDVVRLIPFSTVEYPEDLSQMSPEQLEAFARIRRD